MSRKQKKRYSLIQLKINTEVVRILEDPATMHYLAAKLIRKKPKAMPRILWKALMRFVLAPGHKEADEQRNLDTWRTAPEIQNR